MAPSNKKKRFTREAVSSFEADELLKMLEDNSLSSVEAQFGIGTDRLGCCSRFGSFLKEDFAQLCGFGLPLGLTFFFEWALSISTLCFIGNLEGGAHLPGVALALVIQNVSLLFAHGLLTSVDGVISDTRTGRLRADGVGSAFLIALMGSVCVALLWVMSLFFLPFTPFPDETVKDCGHFLFWTLPGVIPMLLYYVGQRYNQAKADLMAPLIASLVAVTMHIIFSAFLFSDSTTFISDFSGAALALTISRFVLAAILGLALLSPQRSPSDRTKRWQYLTSASTNMAPSAPSTPVVPPSPGRVRVASLSRSAPRSSRMAVCCSYVLKFGLPNAAISTLQALGFECGGFFTGFLSPTTQAAQVILTSVALLVAVLVQGFAAATASLIEFSLCTGRSAQARGLAVGATLLCTSIAAALGAAAYFFPQPLLELFSSDRKVVSQGLLVIKYFSIFVAVSTAAAMLESVVVGVGSPLTAVLGKIGGSLLVMTTVIVVTFQSSLGFEGVWYCMLLGTSAELLLHLIFALRINWGEASDRLQRNSAWACELLPDEGPQTPSGSRTASLSME